MKNTGISNSHFTLIVLLLSAVLLGGCSTANQDSPFSLVDASGSHPDGWIQGHGAFALPDGNLCVDCHGAWDDTSGGITRVSCSTASVDGQSCHVNGPGFHPADWLDKASPQSHGTAYSTDPGPCQFCHDSSQPQMPPGYNCLECHFNEAGTQRVPAGSGYSHGDTSTEHTLFTGDEADVCIACHEVNNRFLHEPFCHNCHEVHPEPDWSTRALHGVAAKQTPGLMSGFVTCAACHGEDFDGGTSAVTCLGNTLCHGVQAPHPSASQWRSDSTPTHTDTAPTNAPSCGLCHWEQRRPPRWEPLPPGATPGCTNNTLCHGEED